MLSLLSELTDQFFPQKSVEEIHKRNRHKGRIFEILCQNENDLKKSKDCSNICPFDKISIAAYELRESGFSEKGHQLEDLCEFLPKSAHPALSFLFHLRSIPSPPKEYVKPSSNPRSYPTYSKELFEKDFNPRVTKGISPPTPQYSVFTLTPSPNYDLVPIPPLALTLNSEGQRRIRIPRNKVTPKESPSKLNDDDLGYTSSNEVDEDSPFPWDEILTLKAPSLGLRRNWEHLAVIDPPKEPPYLSEHPKGVLKSWTLGWHNLKLSNPDLFQIPFLVQRKENELITDIGYLMIGIASRSFGFKSKSQEFYVTPGLCLENLTPEALSSYTQDYITCGTYFRRLEKFVEKKNLLEGLIFQCFQSGVQNYLNGFRAMVLKIVSLKSNLLELSKALRPLCKHVFFLAELCKVTQIPKVLQRDDLPRGIRLLSHLFDMTYYVNTKDLYFVLISILRITAGPYFRFLERWVFEGVCHDDFSEFGLIENGIAASYRDRRYWDYAYVVENMPDEDSGAVGGASFIADIQNQIYQCGKALNFLKLCCSDHFLCCTTSESQPKIQLLVSLEEEHKLKKEVTDYTEMMNAIAKEKSLSIKMHKLNMEKERKNLAKIARIKHIENLKRIESDIKAEKLRSDEKKRIIREDLKEQARQDSKKREDLKNLQIKEDKEWMEMALKNEQESVRREELAKKEIENYYRSLTEAAERREKIAQWKLRRHALRQLRIKFWRAENQIFKNHMQNQMNNEESMSKTSNAELTTKNALKETWKPLKVRKDDHNNIILDLEDGESNILSVNINNWSSFSDEEQSHIISTGNVSQLQGWIKERLLNNYSSKSLDNQKLSSTPVLDNSISKVANRNKNNASSIVFEEVDFVRPTVKNLAKNKEISVIDGRKQNKSKHIEEVLYASVNDSRRSSFKWPSATDFNFNFTSGIQEYTKNYSVLFSSPIENDFSDRLLNHKREVIDSSSPKSTNLQNSSNTFIPLRILMENSILIPLRTQKNLVNQAVLNYMLVDAGLLGHFEACRNFLLFHDGEFGHKLSFSIFDEISNCKNSQDVLNPATLNRLVDNAILSCTYRNSKTIHNVGFKRIPMNLNEPVEDILSHLVLTYRIEWPYNIILTNEALEKYGELFKFLFQLKRTVWALQQAYQHLKLMGKRYEDSHQIHKVHLMRNEMLNFITVAEGYISTQVLDLCWQEFQDDLDNKVKSLDELHEAHDKYLNKALFRCLLNKKAKPVQKIITDIFNIIAKFSRTLTSKISSTSPLSSDSASFDQLEEFFNLFKEYSSFLYQVVSKLALRGYQHHLHDLMLRLNFSEFYQKSD